ncbi:MAG: hypothetical protein PHG82_00190 [Candidatus Gracilibacteria bacterium]|nr:hypothetical protein [Candidatus Gracilibacteria bacterium]
MPTIDIKKASKTSLEVTACLIAIALEIKNKKKEKACSYQLNKKEGKHLPVISSYLKEQNYSVESEKKTVLKDACGTEEVIQLSISW